VAGGAYGVAQRLRPRRRTAGFLWPLADEARQLERFAESVLPLVEAH